MRVLGVAPYGEFGGSELRLATFLEHRPAHVEPHVLLVSDGPLRPYLAERGIPTLVAQGFDGRPDVRRLARFTRSLSRLIKRLRPDVVWAVTGKAALLAAPACRLGGTPIVWHKVDFAHERILARPLALAVNGVVAPSQALAAGLGPLRRRRFLGVVPSALRLGDVTADPDPSRPVIGTLARFVPHKGHHHIIRAAAALSEEFPSLRVVLAGAPAAAYPDYPAELEALARELGIRDRLELPGFVDPVSVLRRLSVFVNATYLSDEGFGLEGLSGAMLEASWAGIPVVATRGGGTTEGVDHGRTGTLVDAAEPLALSEAIAPYLRDPALARRVGAAGQAWARRRFAPAPAARRLFDVLARGV